jgi:aryl-alcohol dehydrogenase-like predicted oxidoreductase
MAVQPACHRTALTSRLVLTAASQWHSQFTRRFEVPQHSYQMIKQRSLGRTGLKVSELCLGTMNFGWKTDQVSSFAILDAYHSFGGNFLQAASFSPRFVLPSASLRFSEEVIGEWWTSRRVPRRDLVLSTRLNLTLPLVAGANLSDVVCEQTHDAMKRLRTDYLDLLIVEWDAKLLPMYQVIDAFHAAVHRCHVRYVGAANFPVWRVSDGIAQAFRRNRSRMETLQSDYSLMTRARYEPEAMSLCNEQKLGFIATSPLAGGFLARSSRSPKFGGVYSREWAHEKFQNSYGDAALAAVADVASRHEASSAQVALAWVLNNSTVTSALLGVRSVAELQELVGAGKLELSTADLDQLHEATSLEQVHVPADYLLSRQNVNEVEHLVPVNA